MKPSLALLCLLAGSGCVAFMEQSPCQKDENCRQGQRCNLDTNTCVEASSVSDAGSGREDGAATDSAFPDVSGTDLIGIDVNRPDTSRPDTLRPDTNQPDTFVPCSDGDSDGYGVGCALGFDCDDGDPGIYPGTACDDGVAATVADVCLGSGLCQGFYRPGAGACATTCTGCASETCCIEGCGPQACTDCSSGCTCAFSFDRNNNDASATCLVGSTCYLMVVDGGDADLTCNSASCYLECQGNDGTCAMACQAGAMCVVNCAGGQASCEITGCAAVSCPGGELVCNRACPS